MTPNRPVNRVTSKRRPSGAAAPGKPETEAAAPAGTSGARRTRPMRSRPAPGARRTTPAARGETGDAGRAGAASPVEGAASTGGGLRRFLPVGRRAAGAAAESARPSLTKTAGAGAASSAGTAVRGWGVPIACLLGAALLAGFAVVAALRPGVPDGDRAFVDTAATEEVRAAADNALRTIYGYDIARIDGYPDAVRQVVTGTMLADLDTFAGTTLDAIEQAQTSATATADPIGVTLLTEDRAELLVNLTVSATKEGVPQQSAAGPVVLRMEKVDGRWLAAEILDR